MDNRDDSLFNLRFCDMVLAELFCVKWRKRLTVVSEEFNKSMQGFWVAVFEGGELHPFVVQSVVGGTDDQRPQY